MITVESASTEDASTENGPYMTGPNADAAASCGDDTLSQKRTSLKGGNTRRLRKPPEGRFIHNSVMRC